MREDMYKVIVERPRSGMRRAKGSRRQADLEDAPARGSLRPSRHRTKWLNENLAPLKRYLATQVGRPWDKVYAEICAGVDRRHTVQQHIHQHLNDFVAIRVIEREGRLYFAQRGGRLEPMVSDAWRSSWGPLFYVDPRTNLLRENRARIQARRIVREQRNTYAVERGDRRVLDKNRQLHRIDGIWYLLDIAPLARAHEFQSMAFDVVQQNAPADNKPHRYCPCGHCDLYARRKRQLSAKELRQFGLHNECGG